MPGVCSTSKEKPKGISRLTNEPIDILIYDYFGQSMKLRKRNQIQDRDQRRNGKGDGEKQYRH